MSRHCWPTSLPSSPKLRSGFAALTSGLVSLEKNMKAEAKKAKQAEKRKKQQGASSVHLQALHMR